MAFAFHRAPTLAPGDAVDSAKLATLAIAFNDRLRSGLGDPTKRVAFYIAAAFRQMRNPDSSGFLWPAQHEFFTAYQMRPVSDGDWPFTGPGEPEGANVVNPINAWIWGNEAMGAGSEAGRLGLMPWSLDGAQASTPTEKFWLGVNQRGGIDLDNGAVACPAWDAARSWSAIRYGRTSTHGMAYGGFLPTPELYSTPCEDDDPTDLVPPPPNYKIFFTGLATGLDTAGLHGAISVNGDGYPIVTYAGTCWAIDTTEPPDGVLDYQDHIAGIGYSPWYYTVVLNSGAVDTLPTNEWVEGPYTGAPRLAKAPGDHLPRIMNRFAAEFRGDTQQIQAHETLHGRTERPVSWNAHAFDVRKFFGRQYLLAPARGRLVGEDIVPEYPRLAWRPSAAPYVIPAGTLATIEMGDQSGTGYTVHTGFAIAGGLFAAEKLSAKVDIQVCVDGVAVATYTLTPSAGAAEALHWLASVIAEGQVLTIRLATDATFTAADGFIGFRAAELYVYRPDISDLFLALRLTGALLPI